MRLCLKIIKGKTIVIMEENCGKGNSALLAPPQLSEEMPYINIHLVENPSNSSS